MMILRFGLALILVASMLAGCQTQNTPTIRYDREFNFGQARTFTWMKPRPLAFHRLDSNVDAGLERILITETQRALEGMGLAYVNTIEAADLAISFSVGSSLKENSRVAWRARLTAEERQDWGDFWPDSDMSLPPSLEGQICVDVFSVANKRHIWHGTIRERILSSRGFFAEDKVVNIVEVILATYPPQLP